MPPRGVKKGTKLARKYEHIKDQRVRAGRARRTAPRRSRRARSTRSGRGGEAKSSSRLSKYRHVVKPPRRPAVGNEPAEGPHLRQLYNEARGMNIAGRSSMNKAELQRAVDRRK